MYDVLGVAPDSDYANIRRVYREKARALRLEVSQKPEAGERLRELTHAYEVLSDERSRLLYDRLRGARSASLEGEDEPTPESLDLDEEELVIWVLGGDRRKPQDRRKKPQPQPSRAATLPSADRVTRWFAASGLLLALFLLAVLLLRG